MVKKKVFIVPHTHWDREWYLPFQKFRYSLVQLIDELLNILEERNFVFMLDGQTIVLEDYREIRPKKFQELLQMIREGKITVGPWYLLPDEWLVGGESLIRNLEISHDFGVEHELPLMNIAYLPDQFGHTSGMPQLLGDLTNLKTTVLWRGIPHTLTSVSFIWKSHASSMTSLQGVYLPFGYGNATMLPANYDEFQDAVNEKISDLVPFSPFPIYLLMNGSDHLFPQPFTKEFAKRLSNSELDVRVSSLKDFVGTLHDAIAENNYNPQVLIGEFRSSARANLLQDTYSARMWIKQWNQKIEDMLTRRVEPLWLYLTTVSELEYPEEFLKTAWKWLLKNQPHDSICGCSVDQTHEEMKARFSWAETICEGALKDAEKSMHKIVRPVEESSIAVFNAGGSSKTPVYFEFTAPGNKSVHALQTHDGALYGVQKLTSKEDVFMDTTIGMTAARMGMRLLPGRKLMDFYINGVEYFDGDEPGLLELRFIADRHPVGEFDMESLKQEANEIIGSKKYKKIHLVASRPTQSVYASVIPLRPWSFSKLTPVEEVPEVNIEDTLEIDKNSVRNKFYSIQFNKDGSLNLTNKKTGVQYNALHIFEDYGDRGDEYTFGRVEPESVKVKDVKRTLTKSGPIVAEICQTQTLELFASIDASRNKRIGTVKIPVETVFRFYRDSPRIDVTTRLTNTAKDHRLRICFDLPFISDTTLTSTHFGCIRREGEAERIPDPEEKARTRAEFPEQPSGIQAQKGFIRVDDLKGTEAVTVLNRGLPEVELVNGNRIAITLLRCIGWLSRSDYPERPIHAGPAEATPGAQEMNTEYTFQYGFFVHSGEEPVSISADQADVFHSEPIVFPLDSAEPPKILFTPILLLDNDAVRISSMRIRGEAIVVTLFNIENSLVHLQAELSENIKNASEIKIDGSATDNIPIADSSISLSFKPREIKMLRLQWQ